MRYQGIDQAIDAILSVGKGALLSKFDIERAYRNVPIHPEDRFLLGMKWDGQYYVDLTLPFGGRPSATIFSSVADVLQFILSSVALRSVLLHYLDDFLNVFDPRSRSTASAARAANVDLDAELSTCETLGVPIKWSKLVRPTTCLVFLGIELDSTALVARLPQDKLVDLNALLDDWVAKRSGSKRLVLSLVGKLMFAAQVIPAGRPYLRSLITRAHGVSALHHWVHLCKTCKADLAWWQALLRRWNGVAMFRFRGWAELTDFEMASDAAKSKGLGIIFDRAWIVAAWPRASTVDIHISVLELISIVVAAHVWGSAWERRRVLFYSDNSAAVASIESGLPRHPHLAFLIRELAQLSILGNFSVKAVHVPGKLNVVADAISRFDFQEFRRLRPDANRDATPIPEGLLRRLVLATTSTPSG